MGVYWTRDMGRRDVVWGIDLEQGWHHNWLDIQAKSSTAGLFYQVKTKTSY